MPAQKIKAAFAEPMLLSTRALPQGANWVYELKLDGYRALAVKTNGQVYLRSRNNKDFNTRYPAVAKALAGLPDETVIDGEVVALDESGRPSFNILQNGGSARAPIIYYVFDVLILTGRNVMSEPLSTRRDLLRRHILPRLGEPVRHCPELNASLTNMIESVRSAGLEGVVAKPLAGGDIIEGRGPADLYDPRTSEGTGVLSQRPTRRVAIEGEGGVRGEGRGASSAKQQCGA